MSLGLVVNELVWNALKHGFPGDRPGRVRVSFGMDGGELELRVEDDGVGIPPPSERRPGGTGTAIAARVAAQFEGSLSLEASARGGTLARLRFPPPRASDGGPSPFPARAA